MKNRIFAALLTAVLILSTSAYAAVGPYGIFTQRPGSSASSGTSDISELVNITDRGAYCDGTSHPLSSRFSTLAAAQAAYSVATSLDQETDGVVIEQMINDEQDFYVPPGTCMINTAISVSSKTVRIEGVKGQSIFKANPDIRISTLFTLTSSNLTMKGITLDGNNIINVVLRQNTGWFYAYDVEAKNFGDSVNNMGSTAVIGFMFDDPVKVYIDGVTGSNIQSRQSGQLAQNDGLAALIQIGNGTAGTTYGDAVVKNLYFDTTGSQAPQLDVIRVSFDSLRHISIENPVIRYNEYTRRAIKIQGSHADVWAPDIRKTATFAANPAGNTDTGYYNLNLVDFTATTGVEGSLIVHGGYIDASGAITGISRSLGTGTFKAIGTTVVGSTKRVRKLVNIEGPIKTGDTTNISASALTLNSHGFTTTAAVSVAPVSSGTLPAGLAIDTLYYVRAVDSNTLKFYTTSADASADTNVIAISGGSGTFSIYTGLDTDHVGFYSDTQSGYGSGVQNVTFLNFTMGFYIRSQYTFVKDCMFYDPQEYVGYIGTSSNSKGQEVSGNTVVTVTSGALNNTRLVRIFDVTDLKVFNNRLIEAGNTTHANRFFDNTDADSTGWAANNIAPAGTTPFNVGAAGKFVVTGNHLGKIAAATTGASNVGTGEDNLQAVNLPSSPLFQTGDWFTIKSDGRFASNSNTKTLRCYFGGTQVYTKSLPTATAGNWWIETKIMKTGSNTQDWSTLASVSDASGAVPTEISRGTGTETETATIAIKCTGEGVSNGDITQESLTVN